MTGYQINLVKEARDEEDVELIEFRDQIGPELYGELIRARVDTAKEFLSSPREALLRIQGMTPEKLEEIRRVLEHEFAQADELLESTAEKAGVSLTTVRQGQSSEEVMEEVSSGDVRSSSGDDRSSVDGAASNDGAASVATPEPEQNGNNV